MRTLTMLLLSLILMAPAALAQIRIEPVPVPAPDGKKGGEADTPKAAVKLRPLTADEKEEFGYLLIKLASTRWAEREKGTKKMVRMGPNIGPAIVAELKKIQDADDKAELGFRLRKVLKEIGMAHLDPQTFAETLGDKLGPLGDKVFVSWRTRYQDAPYVNHQARKFFEPVKKMGAAAVPGLIKTLDDERLALRVNMAYLLGEIGNKAAAGPALIKALGDKEPLVRQIAAYSLGRLGVATAAARLIEVATKDTDKEVRSAAMLAMLPLKDRASVKLLIDLLPKGGETGFNANWILEKVTGHQAGYNAFRSEKRESGTAAWRAWWAKNGEKFKWAYDPAAQGRGQVQFNSTSSVIRIAPARPMVARPVKAVKKPVKAVKKPAVKKPVKAVEEKKNKDD